METKTLKYGSESIDYLVVIRPNRRTLGIEVHPDGQVIVLTPPSCGESLIEQKLRVRAPWVSRQLARFSRYERRSTSRQYLSGESHQYLGRRYRLRVVRSNRSTKATGVKLERGLIVVSGPKNLSRLKVRKLLNKWYTERAEETFNRILSEVFPPFARRGSPEPVISIRSMKRRWGSLSSSNRMTLNPSLILAPRNCIEYVIVHELCHLLHPDHGCRFQALLRRMMPDWEARKSKLEHLAAGC